jgi:hypothetical protein
MLATKHPQVVCAVTGPRSGRRLLLLALLGTILESAHAADIRIVHSDAPASDRTGTLRKILVLGWGTRQDLRQLFEDTVAQELRALGVGADSSHRRLTAGELPLRDAVRRLVKAEGYEGVLVARLVATERAPATSSPARGEGYVPTLEGKLAKLDMAPPGGEDGRVAVTETSLYRVADGARVWSVLTDVQDPKDLAQTTRDYASLVVAELRRHKLL